MEASGASMEEIVAAIKDRSRAESRGGNVDGGGKEENDVEDEDEDDIEKDKEGVQSEYSEDENEDDAAVKQNNTNRKGSANGSDNISRPKDDLHKKLKRFKVQVQHLLKTQRD
ncbi:hypothetical protein FXO38_25990 [Capsicum annuum]|nr:hypothetical protein FXO38_25990 [Capsicum annuum]KAF3657889.1 hypothetical protein FXO37_14686 [Capsicum annuum]